MAWFASTEMKDSDQAQVVCLGGVVWFGLVGFFSLVWFFNDVWKCWHFVTFQDVIVGLDLKRGAQKKCFDGNLGWPELEEINFTLAMERWSSPWNSNIH